MKALIVNRVADYFLTIGIATVFFIYKSLTFQNIFLLTPFFVEKTFVLNNFSINILNFICLMFFIGAMGKSAQFGLHT